MRYAIAVLGVIALATAGCEESFGDSVGPAVPSPSFDVSPPAPTDIGPFPSPPFGGYYGSVKPLVDEMCAGCHHSDGGIEPPLDHYVAVRHHAREMVDALNAHHTGAAVRTEPCDSYRDLAKHLATQLTRWMADGYPPGDPQEPGSFHETSPGPSHTVPPSTFPIEIPANDNGTRCYFADLSVADEMWVDGTHVEIPLDARTRVEGTELFIVPAAVAEVLRSRDSGSGFPCTAADLGFRSVVHRAGPGTEPVVYKPHELLIPAGARLLVKVALRSMGDARSIELQLWPTDVRADNALSFVPLLAPLDTTAHVTRTRRSTTGWALSGRAIALSQDGSPTSAECSDPYLPNYTFLRFVNELGDRITLACEAESAAPCWASVAALDKSAALSAPPCAGDALGTCAAACPAGPDRLGCLLRCPTETDDRCYDCLEYGQIGCRYGTSPTVSSNLARCLATCWNALGTDCITTACRGELAAAHAEVGNGLCEAELTACGVLPPTQ